MLRTFDGYGIASDDDSGSGLDAYLNVYLRAGSYQVVANSYDGGDTGSYALSARYSR